MANPASAPPPIHIDALIVGAGFSGVSMLHKTRALGLSAKIFEAGDAFGGTWHWNRYPGARVDSEFPFYQLNIPEVYTTWSFQERYPDHRELRAYFAHADKVLNLRKDTVFHAKVNECTWDEEQGEWTVKTEQGHVAKCRFLLLCSGLLHKKHIPDFPGMKEFKGEIFHSSFYPEGLDLSGKKVALVGAGATAVQITQDVAKQASRLTIFLRRPSLCLLAGQRSISQAENTAWHGYLDTLLAGTRKSANGFAPMPMPTTKTFDVPAAERERYWSRLMSAGAFRFWTQNYPDILLSKEANMAVYEFWAKTVRARMTDPVKMDIMAPLPAKEKMPYYLFTKRPPLEMDYYEMVDRENVELVNTRVTPSRTFNEKGMVMEDGRQIDFDVLILATGFDAFSGSLTNLGLKSRHGTDIKDYWSHGIRAYLGTTVSGFPNCFLTYTPYAPTALVNGTAIIEAQCDFACSAMRKILNVDGASFSFSSSTEKNGSRKIKSIEALPEAEDAWAAYIQEQNAPTLFPLTDSWWNGANIPGKTPQVLTYLLGLNKYLEDINERLDRLEGFKVRYWGEENDGEVDVVGDVGVHVGVKDGGEVPLSEHVEYVGTDGPGERGASEAVEILRPTVTA